VLIAACVVQAPALKSGFRYDDFLFFYQAANLPFWDFALTPHAGHVLAVRNTFFAVTFGLFELVARPYFVLAIASHALNVALLFYTVRGFAKRSWVAYPVAALWGLAPINQGTISWVTQ